MMLFSPVVKMNYLIDENYLAGIECYGTFDGTTLAGVVWIRGEKQHICSFFVKGDYHRKGIGTRLFKHLRAVYPSGTITVKACPMVCLFIITWALPRPIKSKPLTAFGLRRWNIPNDFPQFCKTDGISNYPAHIIRRNTENTVWFYISHNNRKFIYCYRSY